MIDTRERLRRLAPMIEARKAAKRRAIKERAAKAAATRAARRFESAQAAVKEADTWAAETKARKVLSALMRERARREAKPVPMGSGAVNVPSARVIEKAAKRLGVDVETLTSIETRAAEMRAAALLLPTEGERRKAYERAREWSRMMKRGVDGGRGGA